MIRRLLHKIGIHQYVDYYSNFDDFVFRVNPQKKCIICHKVITYYGPMYGWKNW